MSNPPRQHLRLITRRELLAAAALGAAAAARGQSAPAGPADPGGLIDAHAHVWSADRTRYPLRPQTTPGQVLRPSFTPEQLLAEARACGVERVVLIQISYYGGDNRHLLETLARHPGVFCGVARLDGHPRPAESMRRMARQGVRGIRIVGLDAPPNWLDLAEMTEIWQTAARENMAVCALVAPEHLEGLDAMCGKHPETPLVVDHLGRVGYGGAVRSADIDKLCRLARHKRAHVKVSSFYSLGRRQPPYDDLGPLVRRVAEAFGPQRLMWGSDSPFQLVAPHTYRASLELVQSRLDFLTAADRQWLLGRTARGLFFA